MPRGESERHRGIHRASNLGLRKGQQVELSFAINLGAVTKLHRRTAVVAHVSRGGTGF